MTPPKPTNIPSLFPNKKAIHELHEKREQITRLISSIVDPSGAQPFSCCFVYFVDRFFSRTKRVGLFNLKSG
jgi:hypothetical protein